MKFTYIKLIIICFIFSSCAKRIKAPMTRFVSPEIVGVGAKVEVSFFNSSTGILNFKNNRTDNPLNMGISKGRGIDAAIGIKNYVDIFWNQSHDSVATVGLRYQILGRSPKNTYTVGHKLLASFSYGDDRDELETPYQTNLKMTVTDFLLTYGYRFKSWFMLYGGVSLSNYDFSGNILNAPGGFNSNSFYYEAKTTPTVYLGTHFNYTRIGTKVELGFQRIKWTNTLPFINYTIGYGMYITY